MTKTNFSSKTAPVTPRQRNIHGKSAPAGFAEILDSKQEPKAEAKPKPAATVKPRKKRPDDASAHEFGPEDLRGPTGTVIAEMELRSPDKLRTKDSDAIAEAMRRQTLPYARTRGTFVRVPTFSDLGSNAPEPAPSLPPAQTYSDADDPWLPPAPTWGQSRGPDPELVQTPPEEELLATATGQAEAEEQSGTVPLVQELGWESLEPDAEPMVDLDAALGAFEMALTVQDDASSVEEHPANFAPVADFDSPATAPQHETSFLSAVPTVVTETSPTYGADGNVFTTADPEGPVARNVEVFRTALNRAAITVDTDDGQIELAITTAGKHVMVEATAAGGFTDAIQRDLDALRNALDRHDLELTELSFGDARSDSNTSGEDTQHARQAQPPSIVPAPEHGERDLDFDDDGRQTWVIPTGFRVVA